VPMTPASTTTTSACWLAGTRLMLVRCRDHAERGHTTRQWRCAAAGSPGSGRARLQTVTGDDELQTHDPHNYLRARLARVPVPCVQRPSAGVRVARPAARCAIAGGVDIVPLRDKRLGGDDLVAVAKARTRCVRAWARC
jgi:hypothetical protein